MTQDAHSSHDEQAFDSLVESISQVTELPRRKVRKVVELLDDGNTIPFLARYRKEVTGGLDEVALRAIEEALLRSRELASRKTTILKTIGEQGHLTDALREQIENCHDKQLLEELYLPFKPKRRTRATIARERGLQPLAEILLTQQRLNRRRSEVLAPYVDPEKGVPDQSAALAGACDIVAEHWAEQPDLRRWLLDQARNYGRICSKVKRGQKGNAQKFEQYVDWAEPVKRVPSHRFLAMKRGESEGVLSVSLQLDNEFVERKLRRRLAKNPQFEFHDDLCATVDDCYRRLLLPAAESSTMQILKDASDIEAVGVFAQNLRELLLAPPAGAWTTIGIDPGFRTGCKVAVVDGTGKFLESRTIFPTPPRNDKDGAESILLELIQKYGPRFIAIGNGTASRETDAFVAKIVQQRLQPGAELTKVMVSEAGASIYSASPLAAQEYPDLDVTVRGAISIAHRLQDPLAELVKVDPKSIGVGQYQHDVNQSLLKRQLDREVESCVTSVGVDVNTASPALLAHVAGIGPKLAENIVRHRDEQGRFTNRNELKRVPKLGVKAFEQAAAFLRIREGRQPLDNSAVHPESYPLVEQMAKTLQTTTSALVGNDELVSQLNAEDFVSEQFGAPTVNDILGELSKPGRDPRNEFRVAEFADDIHELEDLREGLILEGVVTNVTKFGAFVDIGVHQDGLVHISELANRYVANPSDVVSVGDIVKVKVLTVDVAKRRIGLSCKQA